MSDQATKRGRGRPPERPESIWVRVTPDTKDWLTRTAKIEGLSTSALAARIIESQQKSHP